MGSLGPTRLLDGSVEGTDEENRMAQLQVRGASLELSESGGGDAVILVHGSVSDCRTWEEQQTRLSRAFRVLAYSRRYH